MLTSNKRFYLTNYEQNAIFRRRADGMIEPLIHDPPVLWPDTLSVAKDGYTSQLINCIAKPDITKERIYAKNLTAYFGLELMLNQFLQEI